MLHTRFSTPEDCPVMRQLWKLAFGDEDAYLDNFFNNYYRPQRAIVLEEDGQVRSMTTWFETQFVIPGGPIYRAAYLYAVATHPDCRGRGLAARLLSDTAELLRGLGMDLMTTVPAEPTLHNFFSANGFSECFIHAQYEMTPAAAPFELPGVELRRASPEQYEAVREQLISSLPRIVYYPDALTYQEGCCKLSSGGLYVGSTPAGPVCLCMERTPDNLVMAKELLGGHDAVMFIKSKLSALAPNLRWIVRCPVPDAPAGASVYKFGMLRWLDDSIAARWDRESTAYLGLAFD